MTVKIFSIFRSLLILHLKFINRGELAKIILESVVLIKRITVDLDYNNIGCNETSAVAKRFPRTFFFFSKQLY